MVEKSSFIFGKRVVGTAGFELVAHPREKLRGPTLGIQAKNGLFQRRFIVKQLSTYPYDILRIHYLFDECS